MPAATAKLPFFFGMSTKASRIARRRVSGSNDPKIVRTRSNTHGSNASALVGVPSMSGIRSLLNTATARSAEASKSGRFAGSGGFPARISSRQLGTANDQPSRSRRSSRS